MSDVLTSYLELKPHLRDQILAQWTPRMVTAGVDWSDLQRILKNVKVWDEWLPEWEGLGDRQIKAAEEALTAGRYVTAATFFRKAALSYHYGHFMWFSDLSKKQSVHRKEVEAYKKAAQLSQPPGHRIEVPWNGNVIVGYVHMPARIRPPLLVFCSGADAWKEEIFSFLTYFLERGIATVSFDGPGQGELSHVPLTRTNYENAFSTLLDWVQANWPEIDSSRVATVGISMGGYFAPRCAAADSRVKAACGIGGPYDLAGIWSRMPALLRIDLCHVMGFHDLDTAEKMAGQVVNLSDVIGKLTCPLLIVHGRLDTIIDVSEATKIVERSHSSDPKLVIFEDGNHVCNNHSYEYRSLVADWVAAKIS